MWYIHVNYNTHSFCHAALFSDRHSAEAARAARRVRYVNKAASVSWRRI